MLENFLSIHKVPKKQVKKPPFSLPLPSTHTLSLLFQQSASQCKHISSLKYKTKKKLFTNYSSCNQYHRSPMSNRCVNAFPTLFSGLGGMW